MNPSSLSLADEIPIPPDLVPQLPSASEQEMVVRLTAVQKRASQSLFVVTFSLEALLPQLPLSFPADPNAQVSPKRRYRSHYRYLGPQALVDGTPLSNLSDFELSLHLIDFSALRPELAKIYVPSKKGQTPFDPVSMFLACTLRREEDKGWAKTAKLLAGPNGAGWRRLFGFEEGCTPSASGLRYFFNKVGKEFFDDLCPRWIDLLRKHALLPERSTYPGDPPERGVTVAQDGMLHEARSRPSCQLATDECYQPLKGKEDVEGAGSEACPERSERGSEGIGELQPEGEGKKACPDPPPEGRTDNPVAPGGNETPSNPPATRRCRAREKGLEGCDCSEAACAQQCRRASKLDKEARFIHYEGNKVKSDQTEGKQDRETKKGKDVFGYRSVAERIIDDRFSAAWTALSRLYSANTDERSVFVQEMSDLTARIDEIKIGEWLDDAAIGYKECLEAIWQLGALRMVDIRAAEGDKDFEVCLSRGYDWDGRPLCVHGYRMHPNGYDNERRRTKYVCSQACRKEGRREGEPIKKVEGCPYLDETKPLGQVVNVGLAFADGTVRLAREIPYGSEAWKERYGRRNLTESRNSQLEGLGLKRMASYGIERNRKEVQIADFLINLRTLGRLVREATGLGVR